MTIDQLKTDLREFVALSETIIEKPWIVDGLSLYADDKEIVCTATTHNTVEEDALMARFIARSRNISPTMAKMLLAAVEGLERLYDDTEGYADGAPDASGHDRLCNEVSHAAKHQLNKLIKLWEETK
jgi:hypothetical protein